jgi:hypothetical protein
MDARCGSSFPFYACDRLGRILGPILALGGGFNRKSDSVRRLLQTDMTFIASNEVMSG